MENTTPPASKGVSTEIIVNNRNPETGHLDSSVHEYIDINGDLIFKIPKHILSKIKEVRIDIS